MPKILPKISEFLEIVFLLLFVCLYSIWIVPHTTGLKYSCLTLGTFITLFYIYQRRLILGQFMQLPLFLMGCFFLWVLFHYSFITSHQSLALIELKTIEKRALLGCAFALGFAMTFTHIRMAFIKRLLFQIALITPVALYFLSQVMVPQYFWLSYVSFEKPYISKYQYVFAVMPALLWSVYRLQLLLSSRGGVTFITHIVIILSSLSSFYLINGKNGMMYGVVALLIFVGQIIFSILKVNIKPLLLVSVALIIVGVILSKHIEKNPTWKNLRLDIAQGLQTEQYPNWKYRDGTKGVLNNASNVPVSLTTYERIAWFKEGIKLLPSNVLGYGLIQDSFKYIAKEKWPDSDLTHTHSGWLDLALGFGIPGFLLIFGALVMTWIQCLKSQNIYARGGIWILPFMTLAFLTSELCEKGSFELLLFFIVFFASLSVIPPVK